MIEQQTVKARAVEAALGKTSTGGEQIAVLFQLLEGPNEGQRITWYGYFTDKTLDRTLESLDHCGWEGDDLSNLDGIDRNEVYLVIEHEPDQQGEIRARVRWVNAAGGIAMQNRMDAASAASFAARMRGEVLARRQAKGQAPAAQQRQPAPRGNTQPRREPPLRAAPPPTDDDIPY
jgi:hypothetical protein